jgi:hypothetical protein
LAAGLGVATVVFVVVRVVAAVVCATGLAVADVVGVVATAGVAAAVEVTTAAGDVEDGAAATLAAVAVEAATHGVADEVAGAPAAAAFLRPNIDLRLDSEALALVIAELAPAGTFWPATEFTWAPSVDAVLPVPVVPEPQSGVAAAPTGDPEADVNPAPAGLAAEPVAELPNMPLLRPLNWSGDSPARENWWPSSALTSRMERSNSKFTPWVALPGYHASSNMVSPAPPGGRLNFGSMLFPVILPMPRTALAWPESP